MFILFPFRVFNQESNALAAAHAGGQAALRHFRRPDLKVEWKSDESPVTVADREAEAAIQAVIAAAFPDDAWLGEETGVASGGSGRRWIVDPIDGTRNFVRGVPLWAVLVACEQDTPDGPQVIAAAAGIPGLDEWYDAVAGGGARCNGVRLAVSQAFAREGIEVAIPQRVVHTVNASVREIVPAEAVDAGRRSMSHEHPLIWTRPNGVKSLIIGSTGDQVCGMSQAEGRALLARLLDWTAQPAFTYRHYWEPGDCVVWDNTCALHRVVPYAVDSGRMMHRTTVAGTEAIV